jgi:hypothetical protein
LPVVGGKEMYWRVAPGGCRAAYPGLEPAYGRINRAALAAAAGEMSFRPAPHPRNHSLRGYPPTLVS